jgi:hypothetical protein
MHLTSYCRRHFTELKNLVYISQKHEGMSLRKKSSKGVRLRVAAETQESSDLQFRDRPDPTEYPRPGKELQKSDLKRKARRVTETQSRAGKKVA